MRSRASLLLLAPVLVAAQQPDASITGPRGTAGSGEAGAYDRVGIAATQPGETFSATHARLPLGSVAEVTDLRTGRIVLVQVTARPLDVSGAEIALSSAAARALGLMGAREAVRVRSVQPSASDLAALRGGGAAAARLPAPEALLRALRRLQGAPAGAVARTSTTMPRPGAAARSARTTSMAKFPNMAAAKPATSATIAGRPVPASGPVVQIAALRDEGRARSLARSLGGHVEQAAGLWRVRLGPFADRSAAQRARDAAISRGYGGASIIQAP